MTKRKRKCFGKYADIMDDYLIKLAPDKRKSLAKDELYDYLVKTQEKYFNMALQLSSILEKSAGLTPTLLKCNDVDYLLKLVDVELQVNTAINKSIFNEFTEVFIYDKQRNHVQ